MSILDMLMAIVAHGTAILGLAILTLIIIIIYCCDSVKTKLENFMSIPFFAIVALIYLLIGGLLCWYLFTDKIFSDLIYFVTFIVLLLYTYYTLQVVKFAYKGPALLHVQKEHSTILKNFLTEWSSYISPHRIIIQNRKADYLNTGDFYFQHNIIVLRASESRWEYRDLLDHHLPKSYSDFEMHWNNYIESIECLGLKVDELYNSIKDEIVHELDDVSIEYQLTKLEWQNGAMELNNVLFFCCISGDYSVDFQIAISQGEHVLKFTAHPYQGVLLSSPARGNIESAKEKIANIMSNDYMKTKHTTKIERIHEFERDMNTKRVAFKKEIDELAKWPLLPGISCDKLKDFDIKF